MRMSLFAGMGALLACGGGGNTEAKTVTAPPAATTTAVVHPTSFTPLTAPTSSSDKRYTIADLRALAQQASWAELIDHLEDIPPSARDAEWTKLAQQTAIGVLNGWTTRSASDGLTAAEALLVRYPTLKESKEFMTKRADVGMQAFEHCFEKSYDAEVCAVHIKPFVMADPSNHDLAFRLGKLVPPRIHGWYAVPAFAAAIDKKGDVRCRDADVRRAVVSGLGLSKSGNEDVVAESTTLASDLCAAEMRQAVLDAMGSLAPDYLKNACPFMKNQRLSSLQSQLCTEATK